MKQSSLAEITVNMIIIVGRSSTAYICSPLLLGYYIATAGALSITNAVSITTAHFAYVFSAYKNCPLLCLYLL
jgi:hypothetical protein